MERRRINRIGCCVSRPCFPCAVYAGSLSEAMLKCPNEARGMFVADCESDLFDSHVAFSKKMRGFLQASFGKQRCHAMPGLSHHPAISAARFQPKRPVVSHRLGLELRLPTCIAPSTPQALQRLKAKKYPEQVRGDTNS